MQKRSVRVTVLTLLLAAPLTAAYFLWNIDRHSNGLVATEDAVTAHLERMRDAVAGIGTAQQSYVAPGQLDEPWFERTSALVQQLHDDIAAASTLLRSAEAAATLKALADSTDALAATDQRTRQNLSLGQDLMAADVIFSDGRNLLDAMIARLHDLEQAERAAYRGEAAALSRERWTVLAVLALVWVGRVLLDPARRRVRKDPPHVSQEASLTPNQGAAETSVERATTERPSIDLASAAALCTDLSRVTDTAAFSGLLGRAASMLDASGLILWMGAGDQLFAVVGHGYPPEDVARFRPIARAADNAASAAWRTGRLTAVPGSEKANGGLVAPLFGPASCIGVLALEIRQGREQDPAIQSVAAIVAAQLATAVSAWPAASVGQPASEARSA